MSSNYSIEPYDESLREQILKVWERSVLSTHDFLTEKDFRVIKAMVENLDFRDFRVFCLLAGDHQVLGFLGVMGEKVEMLFLDPDWIGKGLGNRLLDFAVKNLGCSELDVNEQNESARRFYEKAGFRVVGRSEKDGVGMKYPLLHMSLKKVI